MQNNIYGSDYIFLKVIKKFSVNFKEVEILQSIFTTPVPMLNAIPFNISSSLLNNKHITNEMKDLIVTYLENKTLYIEIKLY